MTVVKRPNIIKVMQTTKVCVFDFILFYHVWVSGIHLILALWGHENSNSGAPPPKRGCYEAPRGRPSRIKAGYCHLVTTRLWSIGPLLNFFPILGFIARLHFADGISINSMLVSLGECRDRGRIMQTSGHANDSHFVSHLMGEESIIHILPTTHIRVINDNQFLFVEEQVDEVIETL